MDYSPDTDKIPNLPGCYIFRNKRQEIIYIGKSKSLKNRVKQYFYNANTREGKYAALTKEIHDVEIILTDTETNALILECKLIKKHKPKYNSQLKKSRVFPYIRIDLQQTYPSITITAEVMDDGCKYFGCFYNEDDALGTVELINGIWQTPLCCKYSFSTKHKPCLNYHINKCCAPCSGAINNNLYRQIISEILKCLEGNCRNTTNRLNKEMNAASSEFAFERAAKFRDNIDGLKKLQKKQKRLCTTLDNRDVYLFLRAFNEECFSLFFIENGLTLNRMDFPSLNNLERDKLLGFICDNQLRRTTVDDGLLLTTCVLEIGASKLFVPVSHKTKNINTLVKLERAYKEFLSD